MKDKTYEAVKAFIEWLDNSKMDVRDRDGCHLRTYERLLHDFKNSNECKYQEEEENPYCQWCGKRKRMNPNVTEPLCECLLTTEQPKPVEMNAEKLKRLRIEISSKIHDIEINQANIDYISKTLKINGDLSVKLTNLFIELYQYKNK